MADPFKTASSWNAVSVPLLPDPLVDQSVSTSNQIGGISAHTVHQTINIHAANARQYEQERSKRENDARRLLAPELNRTIERALYIHGRSIANFICASAENGAKPNDLKEDFIPHWPALYPHAPQVRDLSADDAAALIAFYDSLHSLADLVNGWWQRDGQLPVNIFNSILHGSGDSLALARVCIDRFNIEQLHPPKYESWGTLSSRIERSQEFAAEAMKHHIARFEAKAANKTPLASQRHRR